jgi:hypothetical protein
VLRVVLKASEATPDEEPQCKGRGTCHTVTLQGSYPYLQDMVGEEQQGQPALWVGFVKLLVPDLNHTSCILIVEDAEGGHRLYGLLAGAEALQLLGEALLGHLHSCCCCTSSCCLSSNTLEC